MGDLKYKIYIPSKGRSNNCKTANVLLKYGYTKFQIVIEPQDEKDYLKIYPKENLLVLSKNDQGLGWSRQITKEISQKEGVEYHWSLDDDLKFFRRTITLEDGEVKKRNAVCNPIELFEEIEEYVQPFGNIGMVGLIHQAFGWTKTKDLEFNRQCASAFLINNNTKAKFRLKLKLDTDYNLQLLFDKWVTINFNKFLYDNPAFGTVEGGLTNIYRNEAEEHQKIFIKKWPFFVQEKVMGKQYATRIKPNNIWRKFSQRPKLKVDWN